MSRRSQHSLARWAPRRRRFALIVVALAVVIVVRCWRDRSLPPLPEALPEGNYQVRRVVDGDTLLLTNGAKVRLIGADTPETVMRGHPVEPYGPEATDFTRRFVERENGRVRLQFDRERIDKYDRFLAYVWVDDRMLNEELIRAGLATAETGFRYSSTMKTRFRRAEEEARAAGRGIWAAPAPAGR